MTNLTDITRQLQVAVLLGTERQAFALPPVTGPLGAVLTSLNAQASEAKLLGAAVTVGLYSRAGRLPSEDDSPLLMPSPADERPACSPALAQMLSQMLGGSRRDVLPEALALIARADFRAPVDLLPELLMAGRQQKDLRSNLLSVIDRRGRWLAAQNPEWAYAGQLSFEGFLGTEAQSSLEEQWQTGGRAVRLGVLEELRLREPDRGRALVESTWASEGADDRTAFAAALTTGLSMGDEPFLEAALDDRGKDVRRQAADLLACLPDSRLVQRMTARATPLLSYRKPLLGRAALTVTLPEEYDKDWRRDGIDEKSPVRTLGEKAWRLAQILGAIPPAHWTQSLREKPDKLTQAASQTEWADPVLLGWGLAAIRHADRAWAEPLAHVWRAREDVRAFPADMIPTAVHLGDAGEALIWDALRAGDTPLHDAHPALAMLQQYDRPWSADLSRAVVDSLKQRLTVGAAQDIRIWQTPTSLRSFAHRMPHEMADELSRDWPAEDTRYSYWQGNVQEFTAILHFRHDLHKEISR